MSRNARYTHDARWLFRQLRQESPLTSDESPLHDPPSSIGPFRVLHQLGAGALGPVFRAFDPDRDRLVAIKVFRLDLTPEQTAELARGLEAVARRSTPHPCIATPVQAGVEGANAFLVQQYVPFDTLDMHLRRGGTGSADEALVLLRQVADALEAAARVGLRHGALHPRDILVSTTGDVMVTGIGVADALEAVGAASPVRRPYAAPERVAGRPWDHRADVFSVAVLAFEMLTGGRPAGTGPVAAAQFELEDAAIDISRWQRTLARGLAESPDDRFASAAELVDALEGRSADASDRQIAATVPLIATPEVVEAAPEATPVAPDTVSAAGAPGADLAEERPQEVVDISEPTTVLSHTVATAPDAESGGAGIDDLPFDASRADQDERSLLDLMDSTAEEAQAFQKALPEEHEPVPEPTGGDWAGAASSPAPEAWPAPPAPQPTDAVVVPPPPTRPLVRTEPRAPWPAESPAGQARWSPRLGPVVWTLCGIVVGLAFGYAVWGRSSAPALVEQPPPPAAVAEDPGLAEPPVSEPGGDEPQRIEPPQVVPEPAARPSRVPQPPAATRAGPTDQGRLSIRSTPTGALVTLNGQPRGLTPLDLRGVPWGSYDVQVARPGYAPEVRRVVLSERTPTAAVSVTLVAGGVPASGASTGVEGVGTLDIASKPAGARVFIDGALVGVTPLRLPEVRAGEHAIRLELEGHRTWTTRLSLEAGRTERVAASLEQDVPR